nr:HAMP domain-containing protein [Desulfobulbaceae bacterium]
MTLRFKILLALVVVLTMVGGLLSFNTIMAKRESLQMKRLIWVHQKYTALLNLKIHVDRQLADAQAIFIYGKEVEDGFEISTDSIRKAMEALISAVNMEEVSVAEEIELDLINRQATAARLVKLQHMYEDINLQIVLMGRLISVGRNAKAVDHFKRVVHGGFNDFFAEIDAWTASEQKQQQEIENLYVQLSGRHNLMSIVGLSIILVIVLLYSFTFIYLLGPRLKNLLNGTRQVASGDFGRPIKEEGKDEFTALAKSMNHMMRELAASRKKLLEQSYYSGMADMVSGTLHNLRNALAPVVVQLEAVETEMSSVRTDRLREVADEIGNPATEPERLDKLIEYAQLSLIEMTDRLPQMCSSLASAREKIDLVEKVLNEQSHFSDIERPLETFELSELVKDSRALVKPEYFERVVYNEENLHTVGSIKTQRIVFVQVLANLINNACESVLRANLPREKGRVVIRCLPQPEDGCGRIHLLVEDNGVGIDQSMLTKIFVRGVTGKEKGYGLGLHWCANSIASLNGSLYAESDGIGHGASLHLIL